jgi:RNA polymerase sigma-70 factor (ECF subfamily)
MTLVGDTPAAGELFTVYHDRICHYIACMIRDTAEAEDLTQETFLRAHCRQEALRDPKAARGWLYRIATNVCLDRLRQRTRQARVCQDELQHVRPAALENSSVQEQAERAETSTCVQRCLDYLPDSYRAVILLYEGHGLTAPEIANLLGVSLATVKIRLHRARRRLQEVMEIGCLVSGGSAGVPCCEAKKSSQRGRHQ